MRYIISAKKYENAFCYIGWDKNCTNVCANNCTIVCTADCSIVK